jgi:D-methionine transport system ATP-binding protein
MDASMISLEDVVHLHRTKNNQVSIFKDINLIVDKYTCVGLLSYPINNAGTLLRCINLSETPKSGVISINNIKLNFLDKKNLEKVKNQISLIPANPSLLSSKTVAQNIALPLKLSRIAKNEIITRTEASLAITGLSNKMNSPVDLLSNLDKCKVALARGIVNNPQILLLDNVTKTLDAKSASTYINLLHVLKNKLKLTILLATDNLELSKNLCDQIVIIADGKIVEITTPEDITTHPGSEIAKELVKKNARQDLPYVVKKKLSLQKSKNSIPVTRISFDGSITAESILTQVMESTDVKFNILQAYQEQLHDKCIRIIIAEIICNGKNLDVVKTYLEDHKLYMEILGYV